MNVKNRFLKTVSTAGPPLILIIAIIAIWQIATTRGNINPMILPSPERIITSGWKDREALMTASLISIRETLSGLGLGIAIAFILGIAIDSCALVRRSLYPLLVSSQTIPVVAIAPLLVIWFGFGALPKVLLVALYTSFPVIIGLTAGMASAAKEAIDIMRTLGFGKARILFTVKIPSALPQFFSGLRIAVSYALGTAVIGEFLGATNGIGIYLTGAKSSFRTDLVFAAAVVTILITLILYAVVILVENLALPWRQIAGGNK